MDTLKHTPLRHRVLAEVNAGRVRRARFGMATWTFEDRSLSPQHAGRAVGAIVHAMMGYIDGTLGDPVVLTDAGAALLSEWNDKHGNPLG